MIFNMPMNIFYNVQIYLILAAYVILVVTGYRATGAQSESPRDVTSEAFLGASCHCHFRLTIYKYSS